MASSESEKEMMNSTSKDRFDETRTYPAGNRMTLEEPASFGAEPEETEEEEEKGETATGQDPKSDTDEE